MQRNMVITGGSSGIGKGIAQYFHEAGWQILVTGRSKNSTAAVAAELPGIHTLEYDTALNDQEKPLTDFIKREWGGRLDVLINNAGHVVITPLKEITRESMESMYRTHMVEPAMLTAGCVNFLEATKGQIINISSSVGIKAYAEMSAYGAAKAGLNMLTKIWALELAPLGIRVNAIAPGPTETTVLEKAGLSTDMIQMIHESERATIPLRRRGQVKDMVQTVALLVNSESTWVTGVLLPVDGGVSIS